MSSSRLVKFDKSGSNDDLIAASFLLALLLKFESKIKRNFLNSIKNLNLTEIRDALNNNDLQTALNLLEIIPESIIPVLVETYNESARNMTEAAALVLGTRLVFNPISERTTQFLQNYRINFIQQFIVNQNRATFNLLSNEFNSENFINSIGLSQSQSQAVNNYRNLLENNSRQALNRQLRDRRFDSLVRNDRQLTQEQIDRMVTRYAERSLLHRANVIGRTEALRLLNEAMSDSLDQVVNTGLIQHNQIIRVWQTQRDNRVRDTHDGMNGQSRELGQMFTTDSGIQLKHPGDINAPLSETANCRCYLSTKFNI